MAGNTLGRLFSVTTYGESHGPALGAIIDGCPPGLPITPEEIQLDLDRRRPGQSKFTTQRREPDQIKILSGVFEGVTTGTPIGLSIENTDQRSQDYTKNQSLFRPSHADYTYHHKYGIRDYRGGGRASARETAMRVAAGAIAKKYLKSKGIEIIGYLSQLGSIKIEKIDWNEINRNPFFCPDADKIPAMEAKIQQLRKAGDSIGAKITICATQVPPGLGEPVFDRLDADLAHALMSINAVKGVEIGDGFQVVEQTGSLHRDELTPDGFLSNHAGGILGGISSGQNIWAHIALKPTSSILLAGKTIDESGEPATISTTGRHDPCVGIRATPIAESMVAIVLMDHFLRHRGQNSDLSAASTPIAAGIDTHPSIIG